MSKQTILNGGFDNDPSAEKTRTAFGKVNANFTEVYTTIPNLDPATLSGQNGKILVVDATGSFFELVALSGGGDLLSTNNLSDLASAEQGRTNLGLGGAAVAPLLDEDDMVSDSATGVPSQQSVKAYVDDQVLNYQAGSGISLDVTDPQAPVINNTSASDNVDSVAIDGSTGIVTITLESTATVTVDLSPYLTLTIDGFFTKKGSGNTNLTAHEVGDYCWGWEGDSWKAFKVAALPISTETNRTYAQDDDAI